MTHIEMYAQLEKLKIHDKPITPEVFQEITSLVIDQTQLDQILFDHVRPQMNQLIQALLALGMKSTQLAQFYKLSRATVSYHKSNPVKSEYVNPFIEEIQSGYRPTWTQTNFVHKKRRTKAEMNHYYGTQF